MKVNEAIEFCGKTILWNLGDSSPIGKEEYQHLMYNIIELLQRGEKYKKILKDIKYEINWHRPEREVYDSGNENDDEYINETLYLIDKVEQKYFPKPNSGLVKLLKELDKKVKEILEKSNED